MSTQTVVDVVISGSTTTVVDKRIDGVTTVAGAPPVTNVSGQVPDLGVNTDILATEGDILSLTNDVANLRANLIVTGTTLTDEIGVLSGHVISTGNNLEFQISTLSGNLIASGNNLDSLRDILSGNLVATGSNLKASITGITGDVDTLTTNLISTGDNLQTQILNSGDILDDLSGNLITTGQTLTSNLISTGNLIQPQIDGIESDLITTGQTLLTTGSNLQALIVEDINNLIDTGNNLEPRIVANLTSISSLQTETGLLGAATGELQEYKFNKSGGVISGVILPHSSGALDFGSESLPFRTGFFNDIKVSANTLFIGDVPIHTSNGGIDFSNATGVTVFEDVSIRNLTVTGTETIIDVEHLAVKDNIIIINSGETDAGIAVGSGGLVIDRGTLPDADLLFNENNDRFEFNFPLAINNNVVVTKNETGVYADASNLQQTGVTLQTQVTNNDADIAALNTATGELKTQSNTTDSNLITTGQFLADEIAVVSGIAGGSTFDELSGDLITTGQTLTSEISVVSGLIGQEASDIDGLSGNLITTGQSLTNTIISTGSLLDELSGNLNTTGVTLQNQITSNDSDISTLTSNLRSTGVTLQTQITSNDLDIAVLTNLLIETGFAVMDTSGNADTISGNLISTGQYLTDEINTVSGMTTGGVAADIISGNLITTGQTLTSDIEIVSGLTVSNTNNLVSTGNNLQSQITSNDGQIAGIIGDLVNTGQTLTTNINTVSSNLITTGKNLSNDIATVSGIAGGQDFDILSGNLITTGQTLTSEIAIVSGLAGGEDFNTLSGNLITTGQYLTEEIAIVSGLTTGSSSDPALSGKVDTLSGNLITTGQTLTTNINTVSSNLIATGKTLTDNVNTVSSNLVSTGSRVDDISGNLITTGQTLQTQITSNDSDISTLTSNLGVTGQTLQTQITSNDSDVSTLTSNLVTTGQTLTSEIAIVSGIAENASDEALSGKVDTLSGNLITTGQTLQTQITSNDSDITSLTSNLVSTGQTLTTDITTVSGLIVDNDGDITALKTATGVLKTSTDSNAANLITTGQTLQTQITSNDGDISTLTTNLGTTGQTLQTQITSNDSDISTLTSNLITTGQTLTTDISTVSGLITDNDADITALKSATGVLKTSTDANTTNLITTGQTLQTQITSNDGDITTLTSNLVTTGQTLQTQITSNDSDISTLTTNLGTTGQTLQAQITSNDSDITSLTSNLITTGQTLTTDINTVSGLITDNDADITALKTATGVLKTNSDSNTANLITTGQTLQTQITSNDGDITTLTSNLVTTGQTLTTNINTVSTNLVSTGKVIDDVSGNLITTGQTLQTQITSNDGDITTLTSNLVTTGQTLTTNINTVSTNLGTSGQTLQTQITSNDSDISTLTSNLGTTGQTLQTQITSNDSDIASLTTNLGTTGQTLQTQITSNDSDISTLDSTTVKLTTNQSIAGNKIFTNDVTINNLTVTGTEVVVDVENLAVKDNIIEINSGESSAGISRISGGIVIDRGTATNANILYNDANDRFELNFPLAVEGEVVASASNLITTGQTLTTNINTVSTNLGTSGQTLQTQITSNDSDISTLTTNLGTTGQTLQTQITSNDSDISTLTTNLGTTGQTLQTQITSNDSDISTLTSNLVTTGQTLQTQITSNDSDISTLTTNLGTTGQTLQTQITSNDSDISTLTSNLVTTGQTLTTNINTVSTNLGTSGQTLQTQITSNDTDITNLSSNLVTTGQTLTTNINTVATNLVTTGQTLTSEIATVSGLIPATVIDGGGTANKVPLWSDANTIGDSVISQSSSKIGIGIASPSNILHVKHADPGIRLEDSSPDGLYGLLDAGGGDFIISADGGAGSANSFISFRVDGTAVGSEKMRITSAGSVGIGTNSPSKLLELAGGGLRLPNGNSIDWNNENTRILGSHNSNKIQFDVGGVSNVLYLSNGSVGIGTNAPSRKFMIFGGNARMGIKNTTEGVVLGLLSDDAGYLHLNNGSGTNTIQLRGDTVSYFNAGNVGIGTASPDVKLQVEDSSAGANVDVLQLTNTSTDSNSSVGVQFFSGNAQFAYIRGIRTSSSSEGILKLGVRSGGSETDTLYLKGGNVGIGTASPSTKLEVNDATSPILTLRNPSANPANAGMIKFVESTNTDGFQLTFNGSDNKLKFISDISGTEAVRVVIQRADGNVGIGTNNPGAKLHVNGYARIGNPHANEDQASTLILSNSTGGSATHDFLTLADTANNGSETGRIVFKARYGTGSFSAGQEATFISSIRSGASGAYHLAFGTTNDSNADAVERVRISSLGNVGIGTNNPGYKLDVNGTAHITTAQDSVAPLTLKSTYNGSTAGPLLDLYRKSGTPSDGDNLGTITFTADTNVGSINEFARIESTALDVTDTTEDGALKLAVVTAGTLRSRIYMDSTETVFNDASQDFDFRVESDNSSHALFVQGSSGNVGIGTNSPAHKLEVYGGGGGTFGAITNRQSANANTDGIATVNYDGGNSSLRLWVDASGNRKINAGGTEVISFTTAAVDIKQATTFSSGRATFSGTAGADGVVLAGGENTSLSSRLFFDNGTAGQAVTILNNSGGMEFRTAGTPGSSSGVVKMTLSSAGNLGIGTNNPSAKLDVYSSSAALRISASGGTSPQLELSSVGAVNWKLRANISSSDFRITRDSTDYLTILSGGSVGIGVADPDQSLEVAGAIKSTGAYGFYAGRGDTTWASFGSGVPTILLRGSLDNSRAGVVQFKEYDGTDTAAIYSTDGTDGYGLVMAAYQGDMKFATGSLQGYKMVILSGGSVGIGTNAPAGLLSLAKGTRTLDFKLETSPATGDMGVQIRAGSGDYIGLAAGGGTGVGLVVDSANQAGFGTGTFGSNNVLTITNVGNNAAYSAIALGTATTGHGNSEGYWIGMLENGQAYLWNYENQHILFGANNAERMRIRSDGNVGIGTNAPAYLLDLYKSSGTNQDVFAVRGATSAFLVQCSDLAAANPVWNLRTFSGEDLAFKSGNSETVRVKANGNVGIGVSPSTRLHVLYPAVGQSGSAVTSITKTQATNLGVKLSFSGGANSTNNIIGGIALGNNGEEYAGLYAIDGGSSAATDLAFFVGDTNGINEAVHIDSGGTVQINSPASSGTRSLTVKLTDNTSGAAVFEQSSNEYLRINTTNGSEKIILGDNGTNPKINFNGEYDFPTADGSAGQVLTTDGSGTLSFSSAGSGTVSGSGTDNYIPRWNGTTALENSAIYDNGSSRISLGSPINTSPWQALHVQSAGSQFSDGASGNNNYNVVIIDQNAYTSNYGGGILFGGKYNSSGNITTLAMVSASKVNGDGNFGGKVHIGGREHGTSNVPKVLTVTHDNVGIGTVTPAALLHVDGQAIIDALHFDSLSSHFIMNDGNLLRIAGDNGVKFQSYDGGWQTRMTIVDDGNVGIGTISPDNPLEVFGADSGIKISSASNNRPHLRLECGTAEKLRLSANTVYGAIGDSSDTNRYMAFKDGNIGIATVTPGVKLHVAGQGLFANNGANIILANSWSSGNTDVLFGGSGVSTGSATNTAARIRCLATAPGGAATGSLTFTVNSGDTFVDALYIKENGKVGIGTNAPDSKLEIVGGGWNSSLKIKSAGSETGIQFEDSAGNTDGYIYAIDGNVGFLDAGGSWMVQCKNDDYIRFAVTSNTEHMRIKSDGNVGIGTNNPVQRLHLQSPQCIVRVVSTTANSNSSIWFNSNVGGTNADRWEIGTNISAGSSLEIYDRLNGASRMVVKNDGNVGIGTNSSNAHLKVQSASGADVLVRINTGGTETDSRLMLGEADAYGMTFEYDGVSNIGYLGMNDNVQPTGSWSKRIQMSRAGTEVAFMAGNVGIGTATPLDKLDVYGTGAIFRNLSDNADSVQIVRGTNHTASPDAKFYIYDNSSADWAAKINLDGASYGLDITGGASYFLLCREANGTSLLEVHNGRMVVNEGGRDMDFRVEGDTDDYLLFTEAGTDRVAISTTAPAAKLHVEGDFKVGTTNNGNWMGYKDVSLNGNTYTTALTINLNNHTGCYVKLFLSGDWSSHSAVAFVGEYFIQNGSDGYAEPGTVISEFDNTNTDSIESKIVDPSSDTFTIQLKLSTAANGTLGGKLSYHVMGMATAVS